jgi:hypothetical protein
VYEPPRTIPLKLKYSQPRQLMLITRFNASIEGMRSALHRQNCLPKKSSGLKWIWPIVLCLGMALAGAVQSATLTDISQGIPVGSAKLDNGIVKLTDLQDLADGVASLPLNGSWILDDFNSGQRILSFTAQFKARVGGGTERPAQGFSFVLADDLSPGVAFREGGGNSRGLVVSFDTIDNLEGFNAEGNDPGDAPGVIIKFEGAKVAAQRAGNLRTGDRFVDVLVRIDPDGTLDVEYDGVKIFDNLAVGYTPIAGVFGFGAGTAELTAAIRDNHWIRDLNITTATVSGAYVSSKSPASQGANPDAVVRIQLQNLSSPTVAMTFNGDTVTPQVSQAGATTTVTYDPPGFLASGSTHAVSLTYEGNRTFAYNFSVIDYPTIPAGAAVPANTVNTALSGFKIRTYQVNTPPPTSVAAAERQLAGLSGPNIADLSRANPDGTFDSDIINFEQNALDAGNFPLDYDIPGIPGTTGSDDNIAMEAIAYLELAAGVHTFGVNSDDGFRITTGANPRDITALELGVFDGPRGASDTLFSFVVEQAGIYPVRLLYFEISGGASVEFFSVKPDGTKILINDTFSAGPIRAYRERTAGFRAGPHISSVSPGINESSVSTRPTIEIVITEDQTQLAANSIQLQLNGNLVNPSVSKEGKNTILRYQPSAPLAGLTAQTVRLDYSDDSGNTASSQWQFTTAAGRAGFTSNVAGYWNFDAGNLGAAVGHDLEFLDASLASHYIFGSTGAGPLAAVPHINGQAAKILSIPYTTEGDLFRRIGLKMLHGIAPNGGGNRVNQYTIIFDLHWGEGSGFGTIMRINDLDQPNDGDVFWRASDGSYGKGCCSNYDGLDPQHSHPRGEWRRVVFSADLAASPRSFAKYINGVLHRSDVGGDGNALDARFSLQPEVLLFNDGDDNEQATAYVAAIQIREGAMTAEEVAALGGPSAAGIPLDADFEPGPEPSAPRLTATREGSNVTITWSPAPAGFVLESTPSLSNPNWTAVPGAGANSATVPVGEVSRYFRLRR